MSHGRISITFDDGYASVYTTAFPLLKRLSIPATVYIVSSWLENRGKYAGHSLLTIDQCKELEHNGWEIGAHSYKHNNLIYLSASQCKQKLIRCYRELSDYFYSPKSLAYPGGSFTEETYKIAREIYPYLRVVNHTANWRISTNAHGIIGNYLTDSIFHEGKWKQFIDMQLVNKDNWCVLALHHVDKKPYADHLSVSLDNLQIVIEYAMQKGIRFTTVRDSAQLCNVAFFPEKYAYHPHPLTYVFMRILYVLRFAYVLKYFFHETKTGKRTEKCIRQLLR